MVSSRAGAEWRVATPDAIGAYLGGIARNKRADKVTFLAKENRLEEDVPDFEDGIGDEEGGFEDESGNGAMRDYLVALPYGSSLLTPCQRMLWALTSQHNLPIATASRILGKSSETLHAHISAARKAVKKHVNLNDLPPKVWEDNPFPTNNQKLPDDAVIIENFSSWFLPRLTEDEAAPLGLPPDELAEHYSALLVVPRWKSDEGNDTEYGGLDLLLVRNEDHAQWYKEVTRIQRRPHGKSFRFPEACHVTLNIKDGFLNLEVMSLIAMIPDLDSAEHSDNTWLAVHKVPTLVPVTYAAIDEGLYDDPEYFGDETAWDRWPFIA